MGGEAEALDWSGWTLREGQAVQEKTSPFRGWRKRAIRRERQSFLSGR